MDIIRYAINKPISVAVGVIFVLLFGYIGLTSLPLQLTPDVEEPQITVRTIWPGAAPTEVEQDIVELQEEKLKGLQYLNEMKSSSYSNYGEINLTFDIGTDLDTALLRVSNKLDEVSGYPDNVEKPSIEASGATSEPVIWIMYKALPENKEHVNRFRTYFDDEIKQSIERVPGVGSLFVGGGTEKELKIEIDPEKLSKYHLTIGQVIAKIRGANTTVSAGKVGISKKNYRIRTISRFEKPEDALETVIFDDGVTRVKLGDVGKAYIGYEKVDFAVQQNGDDVIAIGVRKEQGANVVALTERLKKVIDELNENKLKEKGLVLDWVYDDAPYILNAIDIVKNNVLIGAGLAVIILFIFLRSITATMTTAIAIPISAIGTFVFLWMMGRNLNVVSLAGIAFAVGMLVDNAIVSLENIDRHRSMGKSGFEAAYEGAKEVWGAILASTATTVAVFVPIIFMQEEAGQLFKDIAIAITFSIILSLIVSITVIPSLLNKLYTWREKRGKSRVGKKIERKDPLALFGKGASSLLMTLSSLSLKNVGTRLLSVVLLTGLSIGIVYQLFPKAEYLPQGNRNLILSLIIPPPGMSVEKRRELGEFIKNETKPYFEEDWKDGIPKIKDIWYVGIEELTLFGGVSEHETEAGKMIPLFMRIVNSVPDMFGVSFQAGIFQSDLGGGRTIDVHLKGNDLNQLTGIGGAFYGQIMGVLPGSQIRPIPSLETSYPEVRIIPEKEKLAASGLTEAELGQYIDIIMDGRKIDEFRPEGKNQLDLVLTSPKSNYKTPEDVMNTQIVNNFGDLIRVDDVADLQYSSGMTQINHLERKRNITLQITPPDNIPLQEAVDILETKVVADFAKKGMLKNIDVEIGGNASKLKTTIDSLSWNFILAVIIIYLLMSALFENFFYPLIILVTVPLAGAGGFIGLTLVDKFIAPQPLDILAMLGFIILVGTVVNNAILVVHQSLNNIRYNNMNHMDAISDSVSTRIRPIFMSTTTTLFGMLPLVLSTGAGSELYRGLGSILLGGLAVSTLFTLFVIPALLAFAIKMEVIPDEVK
jgi:HAE1 family hydrophobic/amphiphilic exporter-1